MTLLTEEHRVIKTRPDKDTFAVFSCTKVKAAISARFNEPQTFPRYLT